MSGFSIGAWVNISSDLDTTAFPKSIFEVAGVIRIIVFGDFLHFFGEFSIKEADVFLLFFYQIWKLYVDFHRRSL